MLDPSILSTAAFFVLKHKLTIGIASLCTIAVGGVGYWAWDASHVRTFRSDLERDAASARWIEAGGQKRWTETREVTDTGQIPNPEYVAWKAKDDAARKEAVTKCETAGDWRRKLKPSQTLYPLTDPGKRGEKPKLENFRSIYTSSRVAEMVHRSALEMWNNYPERLAAWQKQEKKRNAELNKDIARDKRRCRENAQNRLTYVFPRVSETQYGVIGHRTVTEQLSRNWRQCRWESELNQDVCWDSRSDESNRRYTYFRVR